MQLLLLCLCLDMKIEVAGEDLQNMISKKSEFVTVIDSMKYIFIRWFFILQGKVWQGNCTSGLW